MTYDIVFKPGSDHANVDVLSRLPLPDHPTSVTKPQETVLLKETLQMSPVVSKQIKPWISCDQVLATVRDKVLKRWVNTSDLKLLPYRLAWNCWYVKVNCAYSKEIISWKRFRLEESHGTCSRNEGGHKVIQWIACNQWTCTYLSGDTINYY